MKKEISITVPKDYSAIPLKKYIQIENDMEQYKDDDAAQSAFLLYNLCGITPKVVNSLDSETLNKINKDLTKFLNKTDFELQRFITIGGVKYGFEPNLSKMAYGAYLDISKNQTLLIDRNWKNIMSILYRPVVNTKGALYSIEPYKGFDEEEANQWLDVSMDIHFGCFFFFNRILKELTKDTLKSLREAALKDTEVNPHTKRILRESGELINRLLS